jgi:hypothetical protein
MVLGDGLPLELHERGLDCRPTEPDGSPDFKGRDFPFSDPLIDCPDADVTNPSDVGFTEQAD